MPTIAEDFDISKLKPEDVRDRPNWLRSWWLFFGVVHGILLVAGAVSIRDGWHAPTTHWRGLPSLTWLGGLVGLLLGVGVLVSVMRRGSAWEAARALAVALKRLPRARARLGIWPHLVGGVLVATAFVIRHIVGAPRFELVYGGVAIGFTLGTLPVHAHYGRIWRLAWHIIRQVKAEQ